MLSLCKVLRVNPGIPNIIKNKIKIRSKRVLEENIGEHFCVLAVRGNKMRKMTYLATKYYKLISSENQTNKIMRRGQTRDGDVYNRLSVNIHTQTTKPAKDSKEFPKGQTTDVSKTDKW
jgi:hypothetical protein